MNGKRSYVFSGCRRQLPVRSLAVGCLLATLAVPLWLQAASISGTVAEWASGRPLARTAIILQTIDGQSVVDRQRILTDRAGRFQFLNLKDGAYLVRAERVGYARGVYGQQTWNGPGSPVSVEGDGDFSANLRLHRLASLTGQVQDENQIGLPGVAVLVYRDGPVLQPVKSVTTDERGEFRAGGLEPGIYFVRSVPHALADGTTLLPTFFGQSVTRSQAKSLELVPDQERAGLVIQPVEGRLFRLEGIVAGGPAKVSLYSDTGRFETGTGENGRFRFDRLAPGDFTVIAESLQGGLNRQGFVRLNLSADREGLVVPLEAPPELTIQVMERNQEPVQPERVSVFASRIDPPQAGEPVRIAHTGASLSPGIWQLQPVPPLDQYVAAIQGAPEGRVEILPGRRETLTVVVSNRAGSIEGKVHLAEGEAAPGAPVDLQALDPQVERRLTAPRQVRADRQGSYRFSGLPPGRYRLQASFLTAGEPGRGTVVEVDEGQTVDLDLELER